MTSVDIGVFAHNEAGNIAVLLDDLLAQDLFSDAQSDVVVHVLANGCTDTTVEEARTLVTERILQDRVLVHDLAEGGKSRTWNRFVHHLSRPEAECLVFVDADIRIPGTDVLRRLVGLLSGSPDLEGAVGRPVKDIVHDPRLKRGPLDALIAAGGGTLDDWKSAISGMLYVLRARAARGFHMPIGLPVEDGFVAAMIKTRVFEDMNSSDKRLDGHEDLFFVYESERNVGGLIRHQTRIVVGGAINSVIFGWLNSLPAAERREGLARSACDPAWLPALLARKLPHRPYGYVPSSFLFKRVRFWAKSPDRFRPKRLVVVAVGFVFDAVVYLRAQYVLLRRTGAGYW